MSPFPDLFLDCLSRTSVARCCATGTLDAHCWRGSARGMPGKPADWLTGQLADWQAKKEKCRCGERETVRSCGASLKCGCVLKVQMTLCHAQRTCVGSLRHSESDQQTSRPVGQSALLVRSLLLPSHRTFHRG